MKKIKKNKNDVRIKKTKKLLEDALELLLEEKHFEDIKVIDICEKANIHRSTFYTYYNDKYELLKSKLNKYKKDFIEKLNEYKIENKLIDSHTDVMEIILKYFYSNKKYLKTIFCNDLDGNATKILKEYVSTYIIEGIKDLKTIDSDRNNIINTMISFYSGAFVSVIIDWLLDDCSISVEDLSKYLSLIIMQRVFE